MDVLDCSLASCNIRVSIVTVCFNSVEFIEETIRSVLEQDYKNFEYIVIDGGSDDGTFKIIERYSDQLGFWVSEPDSGVYDAMNKAIDRAAGEYLLFMNAGDRFNGGSVLRDMLAASTADVIYGDFSYFSGPLAGRIKADFPKGVFNHQAVLYRRKLHERYGYYLSIKGLTAADYLFFMSMQASRTVSFEKVPITVSCVDPNGLSSGVQTFLQVNLVDGLLQRRRRYMVALKIAAHPFYHSIRKLVRRLF